MTSSYSPPPVAEPEPSGGAAASGGMLGLFGGLAALVIFGIGVMT